MSIKLRQMITIFLAAFLAFCMVIGISISAFAATAKIAFSDPSVMAGNEVNVTMKISSADDVPLDRVDIMLSYDPDKLEFISGASANGGAGSIKVASGASEPNTKLLSFSLKFKALSAGETKISVTTQEIYDGESQPFTVSKQGSATVKITPPASFSNDAGLSSLKLSPGNLTPGFAADITSYTSTVGEDAERIAVNAGTSNANAKFVISGNEALVMGENVITVKVTAEDGQTVKDYTIAVTKVEGVVENSGENSDNPNVTAGEEGNLRIETASKTYQVLSLPEGVKAPEGLTEGEVEIAGNSLKGWVWSSGTGQQYFVFYGANDKEETGFYRYDLTEKTVQRYFQDPNVDTGVSREDYVQVAELYNKITKDYSNAVIMICILGALAGILLISMIFILLKKPSKRTDNMPEETKNQKLTEPGINVESKTSVEPEKVRKQKIPEAAQKDEAELYDVPKEEFLDEDIPEDFGDDFEFRDDDLENFDERKEEIISTSGSDYDLAEEKADGGDFEFFDMEEEDEELAIPARPAPLTRPVHSADPVHPVLPVRPVEPNRSVEVQTVKSAHKVKARGMDESDDDFEFFDI